MQTTRFGTLTNYTTIHFPDGIFGFEHVKDWTIASTGEQTCIDWLQSLESSAIALPLLRSDILNMHYPQPSDSMAYNVLTIPNDITKMQANLKAPIIIDNGMGKQMLQSNKELPVNHAIYTELKKYITRNY